MHVQWTRPTFATFGDLALLWGVSLGILLGIAGFVESLFGIETRVCFGIWQFEGIAAGMVGILAGPVVFAMFSVLPLFLFPLFRLGVAVSKGLRLHFQVESGQLLRLSRLQLRSYIKLSAIFGFLVALFLDILLVVVAVATSYDDMTFMVAPDLFSVSLLNHGVTRFVLAVLAAPLLYGIYSAVFGIVAFIPFRLFTRMSANAVLPCNEVAGGDEATGQEKSNRRRAAWYAILLALCAAMLLLCVAVFSTTMVAVR
jgi:hypothetical protein